MPNHITNILKLEGSEKDKKELFTLIKGVETNHLIDFNKIIPMPPSLNITSGSRVDDAIAILNDDDDYFKGMLEYAWVKKEKIKSIKKLKEKLKKDISEESFNEAKIAIENIKKYGHRDWYSWSLANWGTKWNSYDNVKVDDDSISFDTAWSTPFPVIHKLSEMFPNLTLEVNFADEDIGNNCGTYILEGGRVLKEYLPDGFEATKFALKVKGSDYGLMDYLEYNLTNLNLIELQDAQDEIVKILSNEELRSEFLDEAFNNHNEEDLVELKKRLKNICIKYELYELINDIENR